VRDVLTSFFVVAVGSVVARAKALPMMHHHRGQFVQEVFGARGASGGGTGAWRALGGGVSAAVWLHVEELVKADVDPNLFPVVSPRPPDDQSQAQNTQRTRQQTKSPNKTARVFQMHGCVMVLEQLLCAQWLPAVFEVHGCVVVIVWS
jgi:hypothetical protein